MHWVRGPTPGFKGREPYFIARNVRSEVEAALLRDVATLWLKLHETGTRVAGAQVLCRCCACSALLVLSH